MTDKTKRVFNAWVHLSAAEQREFEDEVRKFKASSDVGQRQLREASESVIQKMQTGPLGGVCPYCGR